MKHPLRNFASPPQGGRHWPFGTAGPAVPLGWTTTCTAGSALPLWRPNWPNAGKSPRVSTSQSATKERASVRPVTNVGECPGRLPRRPAALVSPGVCRMSCAWASNFMPASVSLTGRCERSISGTPAHVSIARMRRPNAGCVTSRWCAARARLPVLPIAIRSSSHLVSMAPNI